MPVISEFLRTRGVFYSYWHQDEQLRDEFEKQLEELKSEGVISGWSSRAIGPGSEWRGKIDASLGNSAVIVLLLSPGLLNSGYCEDAEVRRAMQRHEAGQARVIPVLLRPVDYKSTPFGHLLACPGQGWPVTSPGWSGHEEAFADIARTIRAAMEQCAPPDPTGQQPLDPSVALPAIWNIPYNRNPNFTGRGKVLGELCSSLNVGGPSARFQAVHGLGGVGKTQLAIEYAYRHRDKYAIVWWIRAEEPSTLIADFTRLAGRIASHIPEDASPEIIRDALRRVLDQRADWLLIFDNANGPEEIRSYLPQSRTGHVLITSRNPNWRGLARSVRLHGLERNESVEFFRKRTGRTDQDEAAARLAEMLGDLPLALEQAAACIEQAGVSFLAYINRFQTHRAEMLRAGQPSGDYSDTLATTWEIAFQAIQEATPIAAQLLNLCAFLAPDDIRRDLFIRGAAHLPDPLNVALADPLVFDQTLASLLQYSLVDATGEAIAIHRLVAAVTRDRLMEEARRKYAAMALNMLANLFSFDSHNVQTWADCSALLPHCLTTAAYAETLKVSPTQVSKLLNDVGRYLLRTAQFAQAKNVLERALAIDHAVFGPNHPRVSAVANNLGRVLKRLGDLAGAQQYFEWALTIDEAAYGSNHPHVAALVNNLGMVYQGMGDLEQARKHFEWALAVSEAAYGPEHAKVAPIVNNLGYVLRDMGDLPVALAHFQRAAQITETTLGPIHPDLASILNNTGDVLRKLGQLEAAEEQHERAMAIVESICGPHHPLLADVLVSLGQIRHARQDLEGASGYFQRAQSISEAAYGPDHPSVADCLRALGDIFKAQGSMEESRDCYQRAADIYRQLLGDAHPNTLAVQRSLELLTE